LIPRIASLIGLALVGAALPASAQNLNPRAFWPAPVGTNVFSFGYAYADGGILVDPSLPIEDGTSQSHGLKAGYVRYFGLAGRTSSIALEVPRGEADLKGLLQGEERERRLSGLGGIELRLAVNLKGAPRMTPEEFRDFLGGPKSLFGFSLRVTAPTGRYDVDRFFNLGTNRWSARPELGYALYRRGWIAELTGGVRFFTDNDDFVGMVREQDPISSINVQVGRYFKQTKPDFWFSLGIAYASGGRTTVDGIENNDLQQNSVVGLVLAYPLGRRQALRFGVNTSLRTSIGEKSTTGLLAYSKAWR
jgi:Putative MetA-pathway of phenol degradation